MIVKRRHIAMARACIRCARRFHGGQNKHGLRGYRSTHVAVIRAKIRWHRAANHKGPKS